MPDCDLLLINPPMLMSRPENELAGTLFNPEKMLKMAINPGILSIASYLASKDIDVEIMDISIDGDFSRLKREVGRIKPRVVGVSVTSGFHYLESLKCMEIVKKESPDTLCIAGGQHIGPLGKVALFDCRALDIVVKYEGEWASEQIIHHSKGRKKISEIPGIALRTKEGNVIETPRQPPLIDLNEMPEPLYELYPSFKKFTPFVEESRGCPWGCHYCSSNYMNNRRIRIKKARLIARDLERAIELWGTKPQYALLASTFGVNMNNTRKLSSLIKPLSIRWNTEIRPDCPHQAYLTNLCDSGLEVLSVGLESASPEILLNMGRTTNPERYLQAMRVLLAEVSRIEQLTLRINLIMYAGERPETLRQTLAFLTKHFGQFGAIVCSPLFVIPNTPLAYEFNFFEEKYGSAMIEDAYWRKRRMYLIHPSRYFTLSEIMHFASSLEKIFSIEDAWYLAEMSMYPQENQEVVDKIRKELLKSKFGGP